MTLPATIETLIQEHGEAAEARCGDAVDANNTHRLVDAHVARAEGILHGRFRDQLARALRDARATPETPKTCETCRSFTRISSGDDTYTVCSQGMADPVESESCSRFSPKEP